jgi:hypothetical protein
MIWRCPSCYNQCECATCRRKRNEKISSSFKQGQLSLNNSISSIATSSSIDDHDTSMDEHEINRSTNSMTSLSLPIDELKSPTSETGIGHLNIGCSSDTVSQLNTQSHEISSMKGSTSIPSSDRMVSCNNSTSRENNHQQAVNGKVTLNNNTNRIHIPAPRHTVKRSRQSVMAQQQQQQQPATAPISISTVNRTVSSQSSFLHPPSQMQNRAVSDGRTLSSSNMHMNGYDSTRPSKTPRNSMIDSSPPSSQKVQSNDHHHHRGHHTDGLMTSMNTPVSSSSKVATVSVSTPETPQWIIKRDSLSLNHLMFHMNENHQHNSASNTNSNYGYPTTSSVISTDHKSKQSVPLMSIVVPGSKSLIQRSHMNDNNTMTMNNNNMNNILSMGTPRRLSLSQSNMLINSSTQFLVPSVYPGTEARKFSISSMLTPFTPIHTLGNSNTLLMSPVATPIHYYIHCIHLHIYLYLYLYHHS